MMFWMLVLACLPAYESNIAGRDTGQPEDTAVDDTDTDSDTDTDDGLPAPCHPADPIEVGGWTRTYSVHTDTASGTEIHTGLGGGRVRIERQMNDGSTLDVVEERSCDAAGGAYRHGWEGVGTETVVRLGFPIVDTYDISAVLSPPVHHLAPLMVLEDGGSWSYDYELSLELSGDRTESHQIPVVGHYSSVGKQPFPVAGTSFDAYHLFHDQEDLSVDPDLPPRLVQQDLRYVEGLGLVQEWTTEFDPELGEERFTDKILQSYSGLDPE